ncbi:MAG: MBL fold metallo-hydrolase [Sulfolobales archaeon]
MATFISTPDVNIFIDPSASLAPIRYGLPPHDIEWRTLYRCVERIEEYLRSSDVVIITHYHYDHHDPGKLIPVELYASKDVLVKDPNNNINFSQKFRASKFLKAIKEAGAQTQVADGRTFNFGKTSITISQPQQHGNTSKLGYVLMVLLKYGDASVGFTSDVEGLLNEYSINFFRGSEVVIADGPPTYLVGSAYSEEDIANAMRSLSSLSLSVGKVVVDHHLLRDLNYKEFLERIHRSTGIRLITVADFIGVEPNLLEARRKELYKSE